MPPTNNTSLLNDTSSTIRSPSSTMLSSNSIPPSNNVIHYRHSPYKKGKPKELDEICEKITIKKIVYNNYQLLLIMLDSYYQVQKSLDLPNKIFNEEFEFDELESSIGNESEQNIDQIVETCPFCDEILPNPKSDKMKSALDKSNKQESILESDRVDFCYIHFAELSIIPMD